MRRKFGNRLLGALSAVAMAITNFGSPLIQPLSSSAETYTWRNVLITVYGNDGESQEPLDNDPAYNYYALAMLTDKGAEFKHDGDGWTNVKGWAIQQFHPETLESDYWRWNSSTDWLVFDNFYPFGTDGSTTGTTFRYNSDQYDFNLRVYRTLNDSTTLSTYADCIDTSKAVDSIPGYKFGGDSSNYTGWGDDTTKLAITRFNATYSVKLESDGNTTITDADNLFLRVFVDHQNTADTYYPYKLTQADLDAGEVVIQTADADDWRKIEGTNIENDRVTGNEAFDVKIVKYFGTRTGTDMLKDINELNDCTIIGSGELAGSSTVSYSEQKRVYDEETSVTAIYDTVSFKSADAKEEYTFSDILGDSINYGITADRFYKRMHAETNFAANYYQQSGVAIEPDLSGEYGGDFYIPNFVDFNGKSVIDEDTVFFSDSEIGGKIFIGEKCCPGGLTLHVDSYERIRDPRSFVAFVIEDPASKMTTDVIEPMIASMETKSAELAAKPANARYYTSGGKFYVDTLAYPESATIYIDGDALLDEIAAGVGEFNQSEYDADNQDYQEGHKKFSPDTTIESGKLVINKKENQLIVFNFKNHEEVNIGEYDINVTKEDGTVVEGKSSPGQGNGSDQNVFLDQYVTRSVVFNLNSVKRTKFKNTAGIFLNPNEDSEMYVVNTSTGWIISDGYVENNGDEWHYVYTGGRRDLADLDVSKSDITGSPEVKGADLRILDANGKVIAKWTSDGTPERIKLAVGTYTLEETGDKFTDEDTGKEYKIVTSKLKFTYDGTSITAAAQAGLKTAPDTESKTGYYLFTEAAAAAPAKITVCDAEADDNVTVIINKTDVTGYKEVTGAVITITNSSVSADDWTAIANNNSGVTALANGLTWTSGEEAVQIVGLPDGTYTLKETQGSTVIQDGDGNPYDIVESELTFTVSKDRTPRITVTQGTPTEFDNTKTEGYYVFKNGVITICDAVRAVTTDVKISKQKVGGGELKGATLTLTGKDNSDADVDFTDINVVTGREAEIVGTPGTTLTWVSGTSPTEVKDLPDGRYTLHEQTPPDDYQVATDITFTISNGEITITSTGTELLEGDATIVMFDAAKPVLPKTDVKFSKQKVGGSDELKGATLTLKGKDSTGADVEFLATDVIVGSEAELVGTPDTTLTWVSGSTATEVKNLPDGEYTLHEVTPPDDYQVATDITFTISNGEITITSTGTEALEDQNVIVMFDAAKPVVPVTTDVKISKQKVGGGELKGATLTLTGKDNSGADVEFTADNVTIGREAELQETGKTLQFVSGSTATEVKNLPDGEYTLHEVTPPDDYQVATDITFTISNGEITITSTGTEALEDQNVIVMFDAAKPVGPVEPAKAVVKIAKADITGENEVKGATLEIIAADGTTISWTSGEDGAVHEVELTEGTYTLRESGGEFEDESTGKKYKIVTSVVEFTINENGELVIDTTADAFTESEDGFYTYDEQTGIITICDAVTDADSQGGEGPGSDDNPGDDNPSDNPGDDNPGDDKPGEENPDGQNTGDNTTDDGADKQNPDDTQSDDNKGDKDSDSGQDSDNVDKLTPDGTELEDNTGDGTKVDGDGSNKGGDETNTDDATTSKNEDSTDSKKDKDNGSSSDSTNSSTSTTNTNTTTTTTTTSTVDTTNPGTGASASAAAGVAALAAAMMIASKRKKEDK